ncbi:toll/interleukin-1 receptor domain-containing protein [Roseomonas sp. HF4]|uniref:toll/interleukin-1 receptor domain-containing protein n=1 Tax=Roseomonas sp. HF4 TaxID=2562313 RepID=UPI0014856C1F|nr:toll/interleukin-1 receptor domain-containing protein [Roseomonas sp. HF4]
MPHDVFLSYASADRAAADAVCAALESRGIACWMAPRDVSAGADWGEAILTAIGRAHAMVLVLSRHTAASVHVRNEVVTAVSQSLALVPVRIEDCQPGGALRLHLAGSHWLNVFPPPIEQHVDALAAGVRIALAADATIEIPRGQAAAMVAAARAAAAGGRLPVAAPTPPPARAPAGTAPRRVEPAASTAGRPPADPAPHLPRPRRSLGLAVAIGLVLMLAVLGAVAWVYEPRLRSWLDIGATAARGDAPGSAGAGVAAAREAPVPAAAPPPAAGADPAPAPRAGFGLPGALTGLGLPGLPLPGASPAPAGAPVPQAPGPAPVMPGPVGTTPTPAAIPAARLSNGADATITQLYVGRLEEGIGRQDWLGQAQITPGNAVLLRAPPGQGCLFNIRVVYVGGRTEDRPGVDLCTAAELRFEGSKGSASGSRP